ncbi:uncharacterized protein BX664DRAFT_372762 [Halteromyces radiatus]|uniref:uncharacterized protein n=1 Tax=Halteromyces radiatus TaxID=101107 RepID=UPI00221E4BF2|nr:uncharacterized protein BX664DRAFT_372762 [Halteromyces radiatus]KAI8088643.1 hypothetical protein BX664DRAFT_372762 [Halteromyces radiatus]
MSDKSTKSKHDELIEKFSHEPDIQRKLERVILISIDKSSADYILKWALINFIQPQKDLVVLVNTRRIDAAVGPYVNPSGFVEELDSSKREASISLLKENARKLRDQHIACQAIALIGDPEEEIIRKVKEIKADVLLMGSRKLGAIKRAFLGSVSDYCVHHCPCAVVIARPDEDEIVKDKTRRRSIFSL